MDRNAVRGQVEGLTASMLAGGERVRGVSPVWAVEMRGRVPLLFRERDLYIIALTDQRLILFSAPRRGRALTVSNLVLAKRYPSFELDRVTGGRLMLQIRLRTTDDRVLVLEFRPRDREVGRELAAALGSKSDRSRRRGRRRKEPATVGDEPAEPRPT
ncbi:MAG: hypothetical protein ACRDZ1_04345 [Acidimicrobiia bacterium]